MSAAQSGQAAGVRWRAQVTADRITLAEHEGWVAHVSAGALVGLFVLWFGPGGTTNRRSAHAAMRAITPSQSATLALTAALGIAVAAILIVIYGKVTGNRQV